MESWICLTSVVSLPYRLTRWFYGTLGGDRWCVNQKWRKAQCVTGPCVCSHHSQGLKGHPQGGHKPWQLQGPSSGLQQQEQGMSLPKVPWSLFLLLQLLGLCLGRCTVLLLLLPQVRAYYITQSWAHRASLEGWGMLSYNLSLRKIITEIMKATPCIEYSLDGSYLLASQSFPRAILIWLSLICTWSCRSSILGVIFLHAVTFFSLVFSFFSFFTASSQHCHQVLT